MTASLCAFQNQLLTKGMVILRDKIRFYEGESGPAAGTQCRAALLAGTAAGRCGQRPGLVAPQVSLGNPGWHRQPCLGPRVLRGQCGSLEQEDLEGAEICLKGSRAKS